MHDEPDRAHRHQDPDVQQELDEGAPGLVPVLERRRYADVGRGRDRRDRDEDSDQCTGPCFHQRHDADDAGQDRHHDREDVRAVDQIGDGADPGLEGIRLPPEPTDHGAERDADHDCGQEADEQGV
ncbi:MAG TPA: hypothetical protein VGH94_09605 [Acidimicrobiales bacterium]